MATEGCSCYHSYPAIEAALQAGARMTISSRNGRGLCEVRIEKGEKVLVCVEGFRVQVALQRANQELLDRPWNTGLAPNQTMESFVGLVDLNEISKDRFDSYIFLWKVTQIFFMRKLDSCVGQAQPNLVYGEVGKPWQMLSLIAAVLRRILRMTRINNNLESPGWIYPGFLY